MTAPRKLLVIGGSAGAIEPLLQLVEKLPADAGVAAAVVVHRPSHRPSSLTTLVNNHAPFPAVEPSDGDPLQADHVYVAPPDYHLEIGADSLGVNPGPKINSQRPAIDVLFRTAASVYREAAVGVVLSGTLDDGASGLLAICRAGGAGLVQDPGEAEFGDMPDAALQRAPCAQAFPTDRLGDEVARLLSLDGESPGERERVPMTTPRHLERPGADEGNVLGRADVRGTPVGVTCPDCGGSLWLSDDADDPTVTCRVGHSFSPDTLLQLQSDRLDRALWAALRSLEEQVAATKFLEDMNRRNGQAAAASRHRARREVVEEQVAAMRTFVTSLRPTGNGTEN
ncbi:MAG: chemotaxis protein CheB [Candidatus Dormibacteraeota bacterium]|nr:chemotaxis protein CheB [Candidatus Dormibacteraeota bacterium]